ncbi:MAG TPA: hypothetical protein VFJ14_13210 [Nocardioidaceae bacterium]|nr:hypothetical protein [Nocardioidaceae bacterium]
MSAFPRSPRLLKGAIIGTDPANPLASVIVFQYNPDTMTRRLDARAAGGNDVGERSEPLRLLGPPRETITLAVDVDAADQLEVNDPVTRLAGVSPALAALEMLLYPKSSVVAKNAALAEVGNIEIIPPQAPLTLFVWGPQRVLPVRLTGLTITEQAYDAVLNPILAKVDLSLAVLSYLDLKRTDPGHALFLAYQIAKEITATANVAQSAAHVASAAKLA